MSSRSSGYFPRCGRTRSLAAQPTLCSGAVQVPRSPWRSHRDATASLACMPIRRKGNATCGVVCGDSRHIRIRGDGCVRNDVKKGRFVGTGPTASPGDEALKINPHNELAHVTGRTVACRPRFRARFDPDVSEAVRRRSRNRLYSNKLQKGTGARGPRNSTCKVSYEQKTEQREWGALLGPSPSDPAVGDNHRKRAP
jgi:hypothetical protein